MATQVAFNNGYSSVKGEGDNMWKESLTHLPAPKPMAAEEASELMYEDGCVQFPDVLSGSEVAILRSWMDRSGGPDSDYEVANWCFNRHVVASPHQDVMWLQLMDREPLFSCIQCILGPNFILNGGSMWTTGKGRAMGLHVDRQAISLPTEILSDPRIRIPIGTCSVHYYLDDQLEEFGPTVVVPGSWRAGRHPINEGSGWNGHKPRMISVKAGGAVLFGHDLWHGAEMNRSNRRLYMIQVHFAEQTRASAFPPMTCSSYYSNEELAQATPRQRQLMGDKATPGSYWDRGRQRFTVRHRSSARRSPFSRWYPR